MKKIITGMILALACNAASAVPEGYVETSPSVRVFVNQQTGGLFRVETREVGSEISAIDVVNELSKNENCPKAKVFGDEKTAGVEGCEVEGMKTNLLIHIEGAIAYIYTSNIEVTKEELSEFFKEFSW